MECSNAKSPSFKYKQKLKLVLTVKAVLRLQLDDSFMPEPVSQYTESGINVSSFTTNDFSFSHLRSLLCFYTFACLFTIIALCHSLPIDQGRLLSAEFFAETSDF